MQLKQKIPLKELVDEAQALSRAKFLKKYQEPMLMAMGVLATEEIRTRGGSTTELFVARPAIHKMTEVHPLAGNVFVVPTTSRPSGQIVFGREEPSDILVPDETVSIHHCVISWEAQEVTITDSGSTNGTMVNLRQLRPNRPVELLNEDIITVGRHSFQYYLSVHFFRVLEALGTPPTMPEGF